MEIINIISAINLTDKLRYITDVLFMGNEDEFRDAYWDDCRASLRSGNWDWVDNELLAYVEQGQVNLTDLVQFRHDA